MRVRWGRILAVLLFAFLVLKWRAIAEALRFFYRPVAEVWNTASPELRALACMALVVFAARFAFLHLKAIQPAESDDEKGA